MAEVSAASGGFWLVGGAAGGETGGVAIAAAGTNGRRRRAVALGDTLRRCDDCFADLLDLVVAEPGRREELLGAALGTAENRSGLRARPFEGLLDLCPRGVRQLGRLVARLFEESAALRLCLAELLSRIAVGIGKQLTRLVPRVVEHLRTLAFTLLAVALDLGFAVLLLAAAPANLFFGLGQLSLGSLLRVGLDGVGEF